MVEMLYMIDDDVYILFIESNITIPLTISCFVAYIYRTYLLGKRMLVC